MFALVAAVLLALVAFGVRVDEISLFYLALAFWALQFAIPVGIPWPSRTPNRTP